MSEELKEIEKGKTMCEYLSSHGISYEWCIKHKKVSGCFESEVYYKRFSDYIGDDYCIGKNLLVQERKGEKRVFLVIVPSTKKVDLNNLREVLNAKKLEFVKEDKMEEILHTKPGNVSIFNLIYDKENMVNLIIDDDILESNLVAFHPLYNGMSVFLKPSEVLKFLSFCGRCYDSSPIRGSKICTEAKDDYQKKLMH